MKYFKEVKSLDELRKTYKSLLKKYHPDNQNGSTEITQMINNEYQKLFQDLKNNRPHYDDEKMEEKESRKWDEEADEKIREMISRFIHFEGLKIEIIGCWIWIDGNTFPYKEELKSASFKWSRNRKKWHWTSEPATERRYYKKKMKFDEIRNKYGSENVETEKQLKLA